MPLFMDVHDKVEGATAADVADAHRKDLEIQDDHGVRYLQYWFNEETGRIFCLAEGPAARRSTRCTGSRTASPPTRS
jgi:hypothetical protein